ncbi:hypothetical protein [Paenibacillus hexagrammi]|uniref:Uncharacterized protein n=1 Tax=Paenibacillus hexagrammi TaxID=2908839 RepID=A0ABY3SNL8_9BACL|nr:hypothetical protein [Paenibacillus sp. YPD9-1]UJF34587.1 hypothetical protein L0M14_05260 [Paenibacillus sp. YPD9-1]
MKAYLRQGGGSGKSSIATILTEKGWKIGSDDLLIVDNSGFAYSYPKKAQIYAYNLVGNKILKRKVYDSLPLQRKIIWKMREKILGNKQVRRRVSLGMVGDKIDYKPIKIKYVLDLRRTNQPESSVEKINAEDLAATHSHILNYEFRDYLNHRLYLETFTPDRNIVNSSFTQTRKVIEQALKNTEIYRINVPKKSTPKDMIKFIDSIIN